MKKVKNTQEPIPYLVSIIVSVYNSEQYLHQCINSVVNQSYKNIELLLINASSTDNSGKICDAYALKEKRIKVIHTQNNGISVARNIGIENSKGSLIFFLDADDFIETDTLSSLIANYENTKADLIIGDFRKIKNGVVVQRNDISFPDNKLLTKQDIVDYSRSYLKRPNKYLLFAFSWGRLFKSSIIKDNHILFNPKLHTFEDVAFNFDYLNYVNNLVFLKKTIYNHLIHDKYLSATMAVGTNPKNFFGYISALDNLSDFLKNHISNNINLKKEVGHAYISLTIIQLVRTCGQINNNNKKKIHEFVHELVNDQNLRDNLQFYSPSNGDSKIIPILIRLKLVNAIIFICKYKAQKRYGNGGPAK